MNRCFNNDELFLISVHLDYEDLVNFSNINSQTRKFFKSDRIWNWKLKVFNEDLNLFNLPKYTLAKKYELLCNLQKVKDKLQLDKNLIKIYNSYKLEIIYTPTIIIGKEIKYLHNLTCVSIFNNININFKYFPLLQALYISRNSLQQIDSQFFSSILNLHILSLTHNKIKTLPKEIGQLKNLKYLDLYYNNLESLPKEIGELENLEQLLLEKNQLINLPIEIAKLKNLKELRISHNKINNLDGKIFLNLHNLEELDLNKNQLRTLPKEIGNLCKLQYIVIERNDIEYLPKEIIHRLGWDKIVLEDEEKLKMQNKFPKIPKKTITTITLTVLAISYFLFCKYL